MPDEPKVTWPPNVPVQQLPYMGPRPKDVIPPSPGVYAQFPLLASGTYHTQPIWRDNL